MKIPNGRWYEYNMVTQAKAIRVVHLPTDLGMRAYSLSRAEQAAGIDSYMIVRSQGIHDSAWVKPLNSSNQISYVWRLLGVFLGSLKADVVMANSGTSLLDSSRLHLELLDIPLYKSLGKRLIVTYQGCDIRLCENCPVRSSLPVKEICVNVPRKYTYQAFDRLKLKRFNIWSQYADAILGITPDLCRVNGIVYSPHAKLVDVFPSKVSKDDRVSPKIRIAHTPKKHIKGSKWIEEKLRILCCDFPDKIEYVPIKGLPWKDCLRTLSSCDILVDQVLYGWYGGISVEAALLGVLSIAYVDTNLLRFVPECMRNNLPILALGDKNDLLPALEELIRYPDRIPQEAARCHQSALRFHEAKAVAQRIIEQYYLPRAIEAPSIL